MTAEQEAAKNFVAADLFDEHECDHLHCGNVCLLNIRASQDYSLTVIHQLVHR